MIYLLLVAIFDPKKCALEKKDSQVTHKFIETEIAKCLFSRELCKFLIETICESQMKNDVAK